MSNDLFEDDVPDMLPEDMRPPQRRPTRNEAVPIMESADDRLYNVYGIRPNLPLRTKVESLHLVYRLSIKDSAELLGVSSVLVQDELDALTEEWRRMGKPLSPEERELERGRYVAALDRTIQQIDEAAAIQGAGDIKGLSLKMNALDKKAKLLGLDLDKKDRMMEEEDDELEVVSIERKIDDMPQEQLAELMACLDNIPQVASGPSESKSSSSSSSEPSPLIAKLPGKSAIVDASGPDWGLD